MLSELPCFSLLAYDPNIPEQKQVIVGRLKKSEPKSLERITQRLLELQATNALPHFLTAVETLVPVPKSAPASAKDEVWPANAVAEALLSAGIGKNIVPAIERKVKIRKSSFQSSSTRPDCQEHLSTLQLADVGIGNHVLLVDDVVTTGNTLMACAHVIASAHPTVKIEGFAVARTSRGRGPENMLAPLQQTIFPHKLGFCERR